MSKDRFIEAISAAQTLLAGQPLDVAQAEDFGPKLQVIADALLLPLSQRADRREADQAREVADGLFEMLDGGTAPAENVPALKRFMHRFATYKATPQMRSRALRMMKEDADKAPDESARIKAELAYVAAFRNLADDFDYAHLRAEGMNEAVGDFAAFMPRQMRLVHQGDLLRNLGSASQRAAFSLDSFEPFANMLAAVAKAQALYGEPKALIDPVVEHTAHTIARATRQQLDVKVRTKLHDVAPEFFTFFTDMNRRLRDGYLPRSRAPKAQRRAMATKAMIYGMVLDDQTRHSHWFKAHTADAVTTIRKHDGDPVTRHAMWRLQHPLQAMFVPRRTARRLPLDNKTLAEDISAHLRHNEPLAPWLIKHFKGRNSRFAMPCPGA